MNAGGDGGWSMKEEATFARIMRERGCSRIQAIHLCKRRNLNAPLTEFPGRSLTQPTDRMATFAEEYRLRLLNTGAEKVVPGKYGELADMDDDGQFRLRLLAVPRGRNMSKALLLRQRQAIAGGLVLKHKVDAEVIFYFDPIDKAHADLAIKLVGAKRRRVLTPEQRQAASARLAAARTVQTSLQDTPLSGLSPAWEAVQRRNTRRAGELAKGEHAEKPQLKAKDLCGL